MRDNYLDTGNASDLLAGDLITFNHRTLQSQQEELVDVAGDLESSVSHYVIVTGGAVSPDVTITSHVPIETPQTVTVNLLVSPIENRHEILRGPGGPILVKRTRKSVYVGFREREREREFSGGSMSRAKAYELAIVLLSYTYDAR